MKYISYRYMQVDIMYVNTPNMAHCDTLLYLNKYHRWHESRLYGLSLFVGMYYPCLCVPTIDREKNIKGTYLAIQRILPLSRLCISFLSLTHANTAFSIIRSLYIYFFRLWNPFTLPTSFIPKQILLYAITFGSIARQALLLFNQVRTHPLFIFFFRTLFFFATFGTSDTT